MSASSDRLAKLRRLDSEVKAARLLAALDAAVLAGEALNIAALARKAGVSRRFVYDHPELRAETERRALEVADRYTSAVTASARVTTASLRADLENAKATNHRLETDLATLRRRLGLILGQEAMSDMASGAILDDGATRARADELEQSLLDANEELARRTDELHAARQINRELMAKLNRERG